MNNLECLECKQLAAIDSGREGYEQGLRHAVEILRNIQQLYPTMSRTAALGHAFSAETLQEVIEKETTVECIWMPYEDEGTLGKTACGKVLYGNTRDSDPYCPFCGRRIKVS